MSLKLTVESKALQSAMVLGPAILEKHMRRAIGRATQEMARDARRRAPKAFSTLTSAIRADQPTAYEGRVVAGVDYARAVEEGTKGGAFPPVQHILDWVKVTRQVPDDPNMSQEDLAFVIARSIAAHGTPPQPFMAPAFEHNKASAQRRIDNAIRNALKEIGI